MQESGSYDRLLGVKMIKGIFESFWKAPVIATAIVIATLASTFLQLQPLPFYLMLLIPVGFSLNILVFLYQAIYKRSTVLKTLALSIIPLVMGYLVSIQTA